MTFNNLESTTYGQSMFHVSLSSLSPQLFSSHLRLSPKFRHRLHHQHRATINLSMSFGLIKDQPPQREPPPSVHSLRLSHN
ncbi:hypothetical protein MIMGU_mgv1a021105mg [Erythranthe guttata]|uniref:Uncharacterized protein n=1 Tax=Erythranthe guttata TaxID=4155 RepID=A0A022R4K0_ERYGU|nr:hypothetical protein MIMGU_mgv1a021105mg [Erythranthe guttata]